MGIKSEGGGEENSDVTTKFGWLKSKGFWIGVGVIALVLILVFLFRSCGGGEDNVPSGSTTTTSVNSGEPTNTEQWETVFSQKYAGKGYGDSSYVPTVRFGDGNHEIHLNNKIVVKASGEFKVWNNGWQKQMSHYETVSENTEGGIFYIAAPEGDSVTVEIQSPK